MNQRIAIVTGVSGVGKSSTLRAVAEQVSVQVLSAGRLISDQIARDRGREVSYDDLRTLDTVANQEALKSGFYRARDPNSNIVLLDAHVVIDTPNGLKPVGANIFESIGAALMVFLEQEPKLISENRLKDTSRNRPLRDVETLDHQQRKAKEIAEEVASELGISFHSLQSGSADELVRVLGSKGYV